jgi:hypothetical protein
LLLSLNGGPAEKEDDPVLFQVLAGFPGSDRQPGTLRSRIIFHCPCNKKKKEGFDKVDKQTILMGALDLMGN